MAKPDNTPSVYAYGMREVGNGKWEAFRVRVPVERVEALTPAHRLALKDSKWHDAQVPDPQRTENEPLKTVTKRVLGEVETGKHQTMRGEREDLALSRFHEAERIDRMKVKLERFREAHRKAAS